MNFVIKKSSICLSIIFLFLLAGGNASAHATPISYEPESSSIIDKITGSVRIHFSENIEPNASGINVLGPDGASVNMGDAGVDTADSRFYGVHIKDGGQGTYTVIWQVVSADDGHFTKGGFAFSVGKQTAIPSQLSGQIQVQHITTIPQAATIWTELFGQALLLGALLALIGILKPMKNRFGNEVSAEEVHFMESRLAALIIGGIVFVFAGVASLLILKTLDLQQLRGEGFSATLQIFIKTLDGTHALVRAGLAAVFVIIFFVMRRRIFSSNKAGAGERVLLTLIFLMALSRARVSHSAATNFFPAFSILITAFQLLAKELWVGGLVALNIIFLPALSRLKNILIKSFAFTSFSKIVSLAFGVVGVTGSYIVWLDLKSPEYLFISEWGGRFIMLSVLGGVLFAARLFHQLLIERSAVAICQGKASRRAQKMIAWSNYALSFEMFVGIALLFVTSLIIITTPPYPPEQFLFERHAASQGAVVSMQVHPYEPDRFLIVVRDEKSGSVLPLNDITVDLTNEDKGIGPLVAETQERFLGGYVFPRNILSLPGKWKVNIIARHPGAFDATASFLINYPNDIDGTRINPEQRSFGLFEWLLVAGTIGIVVLSALLYRFSKFLNMNCVSFGGKKEDEVTSSEGYFNMAKSWSFAIVCLVLISAVIWVADDNFVRTDFQKLCELDGNFWLQSVPTRDGVALSSDTITGCTLNLGVYHFADMREYQFFTRPRQSGVEIKTTPEKPIAGEPTDITAGIYKIEEGKNTGPVDDLSIYHDRIMHLIIVGEDLKTFAHIHPIRSSLAEVPQGTRASGASETSYGIHTEDLGPVTPEERKTATFPLRYVFPKAGHYMMVVNYVVGGKELSQQSFIEVGGEPKMVKGNSEAAGSGPSWAKDFDGYSVTMQTSDRIKAGQLTELTYVIQKDGQNVNDLEPYLGAAMHLAVVRSDLGRVIHTHGLIYLPGSAFFQRLVRNYVNYHAHFVPDRFGPKIQARITFPQPGTYQLFGELRHNGKVILTSFSVRVE